MAKFKLLNCVAAETAETSERHIGSGQISLEGNNLVRDVVVPPKKLQQQSVTVVLVSLLSLWQRSWLVPVFALVIACATQPLNPTGKPAWMQSLISSIEKEPVWNPPATITRYSYKGAAVYYLAAHCCDMRSRLYDSSGSVVCEPDGGITGKGDGKCDDFLAIRTDEKLIWRDPRGK